jgi:hypothetical protein
VPCPPARPFIGEVGFVRHYPSCELPHGAEFFRELRAPA